jgi:hypothetical protein
MEVECIAYPYACPYYVATPANCEAPFLDKKEPHDSRDYGLLGNFGMEKLQ